LISLEEKTSFYILVSCHYSSPSTLRQAKTQKRPSYINFPKKCFSSEFFASIIATKKKYYWMSLSLLA
jgi:hypothetical protein